MTLKYNQILVAVDGSKEAEYAFKKSVSIAASNNATLNLLTLLILVHLLQSKHMIVLSLKELKHLQKTY